MQIAKFNRTHFGNRPPALPKADPISAVALISDSGADPDFDDFGGHGHGRQDTEIAPGIHAEFGCFTRRVVFAGGHDGAE